MPCARARAATASSWRGCARAWRTSGPARNTGLLDQLASLLGRAGHALRIDFRTLDVTPVALDLGDWTLVTVDSGERHSHADSGYNERRAECAQACERAGRRDAERRRPPTPSCPAPSGAACATCGPRTCAWRRRSPRCAAGDLDAVGALLNASHASLRDDYEASTAAVERTVAALRDAGAAGARMVGGGFGGHVLALLPPGDGRCPTARPSSPRAPAPGCV